MRLRSRNKTADEQPVSPRPAPVTPPPTPETPSAAVPRRLVYATAIGVSAIWLVLDQATKHLAVSALGVGGVGIGPVDLRMIRNEDGAFGLPGFPGLFIIVTLAVLVLIARALPRTDRLALATAYGFIGGGALGNLFDRLFRDPGFPSGAVIDFIEVGWWPVFNLADAGIVVGAALLAILLVKVERAERAVARTDATGVATTGADTQSAEEDKTKPSRRKRLPWGGEDTASSDGDTPSWSRPSETARLPGGPGEEQATPSRR